MLGKLLKKIAPALAGPLLTGAAGAGGPVGLALKTAATQTVKRVLGVQSTDEDALAKALEGATPDQVLALQEASYAFQRDMQAVGLEIDKVHAADRADARQREIKTGGGWVMHALAGWSLATFTVCCVVVIWLEKHPESSLSDSVLVGAIVGYVAGNAGAVIAYYFGSSKDMEAK